MRLQKVHVAVCAVYKVITYGVFLMLYRQINSILSISVKCILEKKDRNGQSSNYIDLFNFKAVLSFLMHKTHRRIFFEYAFHEKCNTSFLDQTFTYAEIRGNLLLV